MNAHRTPDVGSLSAFAPVGDPTGAIRLPPADPAGSALAHAMAASLRKHRPRRP